jgi:ATP-dependent exoDNAse (exonuclease V) beta subunit
VRVASLGWSRVASRRARVEQAEAVRTLYVALTRAKSRVVMAGRFDAAERGAPTHAGLLWRSCGPLLVAARDRLLAARAAGAAVAEEEIEGGAVRWLGLAAEPRLGVERTPRPRIDLDRVRADAERLAALDTDARRRAEQARLGRASDAARDEDREARAARWAGDETTLPSAAGEAVVAAAVGTAVHALLERFDWNGRDPEAEWSDRVAELRVALTRLASPQRERALASAQEVLATLRGGALWTALRALAPHTLARELPVLVPSEGADSDAIGATVGAVDWIYWDPDAREVVVVDFKTDRVDGSAAVAERRERYRLQAERYRRAVERSLGLGRPPRFELWFLAASRREVVAIEAESPAVGAFRPRS